MPEPGRVLTRQEVEERARRAEAALAREPDSIYFTPLRARLRAEANLALARSHERLRARVAELEEDGHEGWIACEEEQARADRAEAGLAAAQEALKASVGFWIATPDDLLEAPLSPAEHERLILVRDALARGGGQQDTGE